MKPERFFILTAAVFGILYALIVPPFQAPDEFNHFYRSWQIADNVIARGCEERSKATKGGGLTGKKTADNRLGDSLPTSLLTISEPFTHLPFSFEQRIKTNTIFTLLHTPLDNAQRTFVDFTNTAVYAPSAYLSQSVAIYVLKNLGLSPLSIFYISRLFTLLFWITIVYTSIKIIPVQKWLFAFLALLPSSLFINSSLNADVLTNAISFLAISLFIKNFLDKNKITKKEIFTLIVLTAVISLNKVAYLPLTFFVFLIPKERFNSTNQKYLVAFLLIAVNLTAPFSAAISARTWFIRLWLPSAMPAARAPKPS